MKPTWTLTNFCEIDTYASESYSAIHQVSPEKNLKDMTKLDMDSLQPFTMICGGTPCQDFSVEGKQEGAVWECNSCGKVFNPLILRLDRNSTCPYCGGTDLRKTRSALILNFLDIVREKKPKFGIYENVKNILSAQHRKTFKGFINTLQGLDYNTYYRVLDAVDFGIPQHRERVYVVFIRKDIDNGQFEFPSPQPLNTLIENLLEENVPEEYYLPQEKVEHLIKKSVALRHKIDEVKSYKDIEALGLGIFQPSISKLIGEERYDTGMRLYKANICGTLRTNESMGNKRIIELNDGEDIRIRKLLPIEGMRLMGFSDKDYDHMRWYTDKEIANMSAKQVDSLTKIGDRYERTSQTQTYKQIGNSIVVDVLYYIFSQLYLAMPQLFDDLSVGSFCSGIGAFEKALDRLYDRLNNIHTDSKAELIKVLYSPL